jgi:hypothetical protein
MELVTLLIEQTTKQALNLVSSSIRGKKKRIALPKFWKEHL